MWLKLVASAIVATAASSLCYAQGAGDLQSSVSWCAQDTGDPGCPVTYQTLRANECLQNNQNRSCLIRLAKEAAAANDCARAYKLVYACQCDASQEAGRNAITTAGQAAVCKYLRSG